MTGASWGDGLPSAMNPAPVSPSLHPSATGGTGVAEELRISALRARERSRELVARTEATLADSRQTIALARSGELGSRLVDQMAAELTGLKRAMETRAVIEQAKGILMATTGHGADEVFALMVEESQHENRKLAEIAAEIVRQTARAPDA
jgi:hypothetical protein